MDHDERGRFAPGNKASPGRPKKSREQRYYDIAVSAVAFPQWKRIINKAAQQAEKGDASARKFLADYLLGPPIQKHELTGEGGGPIEIDDARNRLLAAIEREMERPITGPKEALGSGPLENRP